MSIAVGGIALMLELGIGAIYNVPEFREAYIDYRLENHQDAVEVLAHLINAEAGASWCDRRTQYLVGSVVINRVHSESFPNTLEGVIYQPGQYAVTPFMMDLQPSEEVYEIAKELLVFGTDIPENVVFQANFTQGRGVYEYIDTVYFCYM